MILPKYLFTKFVVFWTNCHCVIGLGSTYRWVLYRQWRYTMSYHVERSCLMTHIFVFISQIYNIIFLNLSELEMPRFPTILIEVLSLDNWNRFRTEGYTYLTIPGQPGESLIKSSAGTKVNNCYDYMYMYSQKIEKEYLCLSYIANINKTR